MKVSSFVVSAALVSLASLAPGAESLEDPRPGTGSPRLSGPARRLVPGRAQRILFAPQDLRAVPAVRSETPAPLTALGLAPEMVFAETNASERFSQLQQATAVLAGGGVGVVWEAGSYPSRDVRMQWVDGGGRLAFPPGGLPVAGTPSDEFNAVIAAHPTSGAYVAFTVGPTANHVRVQRFDGIGTPRWPGTGVVAGLVGSSLASNPHLVPNPLGGVFVCFEIENPAYDLRCQLIDESGARRWGDAGRSVGVGLGWGQEWRVLPRGLSDGAGGLIVFWRNQRNPFAPRLEPMLMEGQRFASDGARLWGEAPKVVRTTGLASSNGHDYNLFQVVSDGAGGAIIAFDDWMGGSAGLDVVAQRVSASGDLLWGAGTIVAAGSGLQQHEQTVAGPGGGAFVAVFEGVTAQHSRLLLYRLGADGSHLWSDRGVLLSDPGATALDYGVDGSFDDGLLRLIWTHQRAPFGQDFDVHFAGMDPRGERWGGAGGIPITTAAYAQFSRELVYSPVFGGVLAVWDDLRKNDWDDLDAFGATLKDSDWVARRRFFTVDPCRLLDTRNPAGPRGGPALGSGQARTVPATGACGIPAGARAIAVNITAVSPRSGGYLAAYPSDWPRPLASTLNFTAGRTRANNAILRLSWDGAFALYPIVADHGSSHFVVDVTGYFD